MDEKVLQYVLAIAKTKSFTQAAEQLYVSQPALSQAIKRLECELEVELFYRDRTKVVLTPAGVIFVEGAREILKQVDNLKRQIKHFRANPQDTISIGVSQFYGKHFLYFLIDGLKQNLPSYRIKIIEGESKFLENLIDQGKLDFGIFPAPIYNKSVHFTPIYIEKILFTFNKRNKDAFSLLPNAFDGKYINLFLYKEFPFILLKEGLKLRVLADKICTSYGFKPKAILESENLDTIYSLVTHNYGVAFLPSTIFQSINIEKSEVSFYPLKSKLSKRDIGIAYKEGYLDKNLVSKVVQSIGNKVSTNKNLK
ncbi:LysR family transcriptional regulator, hydrogen peroxide-inducible genes activator [Acetomicrobium flavidum]|uniref:LysR family transcriptional regulator, hydrogen peroxide-inducible genes activator n=1 Tax=Acetomicrobium flavidum TaxID=49896 RepID=A0ABY1JDU1_9BACT|nr:LysR family transcriptional regulator, hydrogen peroxide-inducible genes activator [Acetomicrobium flavidum]